MLRIFFFALAIGWFAFPDALAQSMPQQGQMPMGQGQMGPMGTAEGTVRKIDKSAGKITLRHGPIAGLDMPAMSMVFRVKDPALLDSVAVGDKIGFTVANENGTMYVTKIEKRN